MPIFTKLPSKADFIKIQAKHAVLPGPDTNALLKSIETLDAALKVKGAPVVTLVKPVQGLLDAIKQYDAKNGKKNPKFVASINKEFGDPARSVAKSLIEMGQVEKRISTELDDAEKHWKVVIKFFDKPLDDGSAPKVEKELQLAKGFMNQAMAGARDIQKDLGGSEKFKGVYDTLNAVNGVLQTTEKDIVMMIKAKKYGDNKAAIMAGLNKAHNATTHALKLVRA